MYIFIILVLFLIHCNNRVCFACVRALSVQAVRHEVFWLRTWHSADASSPEGPGARLSSTMLLLRDVCKATEHWWWILFNGRQKIGMQAGLRGRQGQRWVWVSQIYTLFLVVFNYWRSLFPFKMHKLSYQCGRYLNSRIFYTKNALKNL